MTREQALTLLAENRKQPSTCSRCGEATPTLADKQWHCIIHKYDKEAK